MSPCKIQYKNVKNYVFEVKHVISTVLFLVKQKTQCTAVSN